MMLIRGLNCAAIPLSRQWCTRRLSTASCVEHIIPSATVTFSDTAANSWAQTTIQFVRQEEWRTTAEAYLGAQSIAPAIARSFSGKQSQIVRLLRGGDDDSQLLLVGIGEAKITSEAALQSFRSASFTAMSTAATLSGVTHVDVRLPDPDLMSGIESEDEMARAVVQACVLSNYSFDKYKSNDEGSSNVGIDSIHFVGNEGHSLEQVVDEQNILAQATRFSRDIGNERGDVANPEYMRNVCADLSQRHGFSLTVIEGDDHLREERLHLLRAVGQGACVRPRLVMLEYRGDPSSDDTIALVGKGITFDTGGLNLKPTGFIEDMHLDKGGAVAVLGAMEAIGHLRPKANVVACCAFAENAISASAVKPHAIVQARNGRSIEIGNTDAEGRLVLADAMTYVQDTFKPHTLIDAATLTGACVVALGEYTAGVFSNDVELSSHIQRVGDDCFERCWPLPVLPEHTAELKSGSFADLRSIGAGREGGACTAAAFLNEFVQPGVRWAHLDVAGPAMYSKQREFMPKGATGFGACLLAKLLMSMQRSAAP